MFFITGLSKLTFEDHEKIKGIDITKLSFPDLDVSKYENQIGYQYLLTYEDARQVFLSCQMWLNKAKEYYKLDTLASDYIEIVQDSSQSYSYLAFFEEDDDRRSKMHKRRVDMLEELLKQVNPVYYLQFCRQIWFELGEVYSEMLNIKLDKQNKVRGNPVPQALKKINTICEKSIENYTAYLNSVKDKEGKMPASLTDDLIRPVISAYAFIGRNSMNRIAVDKSMHLIHLQQSLDSYQAVVDICMANETAAAKMHEEFQLCREMVNILPLKIKKIQHAIIE